MHGPMSEAFLGPGLPVPESNFIFQTPSTPTHYAVIVLAGLAGPAEIGRAGAQQAMNLSGITDQAGRASVNQSPCRPPH
jgi:hypothetical protein